MKARRPWPLGRKQGISRGIAVFGPSGFDDPGHLRVLMHEQHEQLPRREASSRRGASSVPDRGAWPDHDREGLARLDAQLDELSRDPQLGPMLGNEVSAYLGCVLVDVVPGAQWAVWANGHPVVSVGGREFDVIEIVRRRLDTGEPRLPAVLDEAAGTV